MATTLEKIRRLEQSLAADNSTVDPVLDMTIDKLLAREISHLQKIQRRLSEQLLTFEKRYGIESLEFCRRYQNGDMGDEMDFVEWAATADMLKKAEERLSLLDAEAES